MDALVAGQPTVTTVHSVHGRNAAYLEIVPNGAGIRVRPTDLGKRALNHFWPVWLRQLLLEQSKPERVYAIEVSNNHVLVTSDASLDAMIGTVHHVAAQLQPLKKTPFERDFIYASGSSNLRWWVKEWSRTIPWALILDNIQLPQRVRLHVALWDGAPYRGGVVGSATLERPQHYHVPLNQLAMLVELQVAQACHH